MRTIGVITTARSEYGIIVPILRAIQADPTLQLHLIVGGAHLAPEFGRTIENIERDGFPIADRIEFLLSSDSPLGTAKSIGLAVIGFAESYTRSRPDILIVTGDRFEMHAAVLAALPFGIPVAHIHGGEVTVGAIDDALRHGITKMAHLHFPATDEYAARLMRLGEEPWRITVAGAPSLDNLQSMELLERDALANKLAIAFDPAPLLVTFHAVTTDLEHTQQKIDALLAALARVDRTVIFTGPNADPGGRLIAASMHAFVEQHAHAHFVENLGTRNYFSVMRNAAAMIGNSSSGIIEAASFDLPVVNLGARQTGRTKGPNVIDVASDEDADAIFTAIARACDPAFRPSIRGMTNPYGNGTAATAILTRIREIPLDATLLVKQFHDAPSAGPSAAD